MIDALSNFLTGQGFAVMMLACGTLVVVVEKPVSLLLSPRDPLE
jgi:hypothetical protein